MDRQAVVQIVVVLVLVSIAARWVPAGPRELGFGDPVEALRLDGFLADNDDRALAKARLMYGRRERPSLVRHWGALLEHAEGLRRSAAAGEVEQIQLSGIPRNDFWFLTYELFPIPVTGRPYEEGSRFDEPLLPGATRFPQGITDDVDLAEWDAELQSEERRRREQRRRQDGRPGRDP